MLNEEGVNLVMDNILFLLQMSSPGDPAGGQQLITMLVTFGIIILIFYFLVMRPQSKRQKEAKLMLAALTKGDRVQTAGGIRGEVTSLDENKVVLKVDENTKIEFSKSSIVNVIEKRGKSSSSGKKEKE